MDKYIYELGNLIKECEKLINKRKFKTINEYYGYGEFEVALEGLIIELSESKQYPKNFNSKEWEKIAIDFELDKETVLDDDTWKKFLKWCDEYKIKK